MLEGLPAHKKVAVKDNVRSVGTRLTLHFLPGYAPDLMNWCGAISSAPKPQKILSKRANNRKIVSKPNCLRCSVIAHSCGHSSAPRPSPILLTAE